MAADTKPASTEPQPAQSTAVRKNARTSGPVIMVAGLFLAVAAVLFVPMMTGGAAGTQSSSSPVSSTVETAVAYQSVADAAEVLGYAPALPAAPESARINAVNVLDGKVLEVVYAMNGTTIVYRTAQGAEDLSGVYTEFAYETLDETDGVARSYSGASASKLQLAVWASEGYSYSLYAQAGVDAEVLQALAQSL